MVPKYEIPWCLVQFKTHHFFLQHSTGPAGYEVKREIVNVGFFCVSLYENELGLCLRCMGMTQASQGILGLERPSFCCYCHVRSAQTKLGQTQLSWPVRPWRINWTGTRVCTGRLCWPQRSPLPLWLPPYAPLCLRRTGMSVVSIVMCFEKITITSRMSLCQFVMGIMLPLLLLPVIALHFVYERESREVQFWPNGEPVACMISKCYPFCIP